jgi:hypothetical protein
MTLKNIWRFCSSIELCLGLLALVCVVMAAGFFLLKGDSAAAINSVPLLVWLRSRAKEISLEEVGNEVVSQGIVV